MKVKQIYLDTGVICDVFCEMFDPRREGKWALVWNILLILTQRLEGGIQTTEDALFNHTLL